MTAPTTREDGTWHSNAVLRRMALLHYLPVNARPSCRRCKNCIPHIAIISGRISFKCGILRCIVSSSAICDGYESSK